MSMAPRTSWYDRLYASRAGHDTVVGGVEPTLASKLLKLRKGGALARGKARLGLAGPAE